MVAASQLLDTALGLASVRENSQGKGIRVNRRMPTNMLNGGPLGDKNQGGLYVFLFRVNMHTWTFLIKFKF